MIFCTLIHPAFNCIYTIDSLTPGSVLRNVPCEVYPAGKGITIAGAVRALGEEVCVVGILPEHDHARVVSYLDGMGVGHRFLSAPGSARLNMTVLERESGSVTRINGTVPAFPLRVQEEFLSLVQDLLREGDHWCLCGGIPAGFEDNVYAQMVQMATAAGVETFLDTHGEELRLALRAKPAMVRTAIAELETLFGERINGVRHIALKGKNLLDRGVSRLFVSLGTDGLIALHDNDCLLCVPPQVKALNGIGCDESLMAGILVSRARSFSFPEMCRLAVACGTAKSMHPGTETISRDEVWQLMEEVRITSA